MDVKPAHKKMGMGSQVKKYTEMFAFLENNNLIIKL